MGRRRGGAALVQPEQERLSRLGREAPRGVGFLDAPQLAIVGKEHLVEQDLARLEGDPTSRLAALAGRPPGGPAARGEGEGAVELFVVDADLLRTGVSGRVDRIRHGHVSLEEADSLAQVIDHLLPGVALLVEERRHAAGLPFGRVPHAGEGVGERRIHRRGLRRRSRRRGLEQLHVIGLGAGASHPRVTERDLIADAEGVTAGGQIVEAEHPPQAEEPSSLERAHEREDQIRLVPCDAVVEADSEAERAQHAQGAHATVGGAAARAHVALPRDPDGGDRRRDRLEQAEMEVSGRGGVVAVRRPVGTHREATVRHEAGRLSHRFDLAAFVRRTLGLVRTASRSSQQDCE